MKAIGLPMAALLLTLVFGNVALAQGGEFRSGNSMLAACQRWANSSKAVSNSLESLNEGRCGGMISAIFFYGEVLPTTIRFCSPAGANPGQALRIVIKYLTDNPAITHRDFLELAPEALHRAWPCK
jgi:hypothetical protein